MVRIQVQESKALARRRRAAGQPVLEGIREAASVPAEGQKLEVDGQTFDALEVEVKMRAADAPADGVAAVVTLIDA